MIRETELECCVLVRREPLQDVPKTHHMLIHSPRCLHKSVQQRLFLAYIPSVVSNFRCTYCLCCQLISDYSYENRTTLSLTVATLSSESFFFWNLLYPAVRSVCPTRPPDGPICSHVSAPAFA